MAAMIHRADRVREKQHEAILRNTLMVATDGQQVGQINGLAAIELGEFTFAHPVRITAAVRMYRAWGYAGDEPSTGIYRE